MRSVDTSKDATKEVAKVEPGTPTENINLVLTQRPEPRRTEADFRLPEGARKKAGGDDCKTQ